MDFKIGDVVKKYDDDKEYTIEAVHDYGFHTPPKLSIWMVDKDLNNHTANSDQVYIERNILKRVYKWIMTKIAFLRPKPKTK